MQVPYEFKLFCIPFDPDIYEQDKDQYLPGEDDFAFAVRKLSPRNKGVVQEFVNRVLEANLTDRELADVWARGCDRIAFVDQKDYRLAFQRIRQLLERAP